jgi:hypothetical protein
MRIARQLDLTQGVEIQILTSFQMRTYFGPLHPLRIGKRLEQRCLLSVDLPMRGGRLMGGCKDEQEPCLIFAQSEAADLSTGCRVAQIDVLVAPRITTGHEGGRAVGKI